jgi:magnesium chelatase family protein
LVIRGLFVRIYTMLAKIYTGTLVGLDGIPITVEVDVASRGFPTFTIVGLPSKEINESKERVRTAIVNAGFRMPESRITVNLAPADVPKSGSLFDLPIASGILASQKIIETSFFRDNLFVGELSLEGEVRRVAGILSIVMMAKNKGYSSVFVPSANAREASHVEGVTVFGVGHILDLVAHARGDKLIIPQKYEDVVVSQQDYPNDFCDIRGQEHAKRALEIASTGGHNLHMRGVPGAGKTMLSRAFASILPPLEREEVLEVTRIYSTVGMLGSQAVMTLRPFRSPHHTTSKIGLIGGGSNPMPGEISLAHRGVLFLDEFAEFERGALEALRQPLEDGVVTISRASGSLTFPARFLLLSASNPCPCGYMGHPKRNCICSPSSILKYKKRLSGPILDRIDMHIDIPPVEYDKLAGTTGENDTEEKNEKSDQIRARVSRARLRQKARLAPYSKLTNSEMTSAELKRLCKFAPTARDLLKSASAKLQISARSFFKVAKVAQTIADLAESDVVEYEHVSESLQYRARTE